MVFQAAGTLPTERSRFAGLTKVVPSVSRAEKPLELASLGECCLDCHWGALIDYVKREERWNRVALPALAEVEASDQTRAGESGGVRGLHSRQRVLT